MVWMTVVRSDSVGNQLCKSLENSPRHTSVAVLSPGYQGWLVTCWGSSFLPFLVTLGVELCYLFDFFLVS